HFQNKFIALTPNTLILNLILILHKLMLTFLATFKEWRVSMDYNHIIYDEGDQLEHLNTPNFSNMYLVISGMIHFQKVKSNFIFHRGDVFVVYDFEENLIVHREGMLACISVNNLSYHRFTLINRENLLEKYKLINYLNSSQANIYGQLTYSNKLIKNVVEYINQHYKQPLTLNLLAKTLYVNSSYLSREFSKKMNISLIKYIKKVKIYSLSRDLLTNGNSESIWVDYGFRSYNTYLRDFKNVMHMTPKDFIKQHNSKNTNTKIEPHQLYNQLQLILDTIKSE